ncbi:MAG: hypothetical protein JOZ95_27030 [Solirubrobacterales bacterium]|nr:hypothetical protein [Solirubrobacterales bacterium]
MSHYLLEKSVTGKPSPFTTFYYPSKMFSDAQTTLNVLVTLEDAFIAAYLNGHAASDSRLATPYGRFPRTRRACRLEFAVSHARRPVSAHSTARHLECALIPPLDIDLILDQIGDDYA